MIQMRENGVVILSDYIASGATRDGRVIAQTNCQSVRRLATIACMKYI